MREKKQESLAWQNQRERKRANAKFNATRTPDRPGPGFLSLSLSSNLAYVAHLNASTQRLTQLNAYESSVVGSYVRVHI